MNMNAERRQHGRPVPRLLAALPVASEPVANDGPALVDLGRVCESAGFDGIVVSDHVVMSTEPTGFPGGRPPFPSYAPFFEPLVLAAAILARTERLVIATGIVIAPLRPAVLLAKMVASIDQISGGRLELGVGVGWQREEYEAMGLDFSHRGRMLTDTIRACRTLWSSGPSTFRSSTTSFENVWCSPAPTGTNGPPVLFAGELSERTLQRIVELGQGWLPMFGASIEAIQRDVTRLGEALEASGRSLSEMRIRVDLGSTSPDIDRNDLTALFAEARRLLAIGVTDVVLRLGPLFRQPEPRDELVSQAVREWLSVSES